MHTEEITFVFGLFTAQLHWRHRLQTRAVCKRFVSVFVYEKVGQTAPHAEIGALNAESFCERVLSAGNLVVHEGNTLLPKDEVEMLTVLCINRGWMDGVHARALIHAPCRGGQGAGRSDVDLSVSVSPPATSEGPGPLRRKQKQNVFKRFLGLWALK